MVRPNPAQQELLELLARTADNTIEIDNYGPYYSGMILIYNVTAELLTPNVTPTLQIEDNEGDWQNIWTSATFISQVGSFEYLFQRGVIAADFNGVEAVSLQLPQRFRIFNDHSDTDSMTYSLRVHWLP